MDKETRIVREDSGLGISGNNAVKKTIERNPHATIETFEKFDGSIDVTVKPKPLRLRFTEGSSPSREHLLAIQELQEAQAEHLIAKHSLDPDWARYTTQRIEKAKVRLREVQ